MPVLIALSFLVFVALLWAAISILASVRRARRRRRRHELEAAGMHLGSVPVPAVTPGPLVYEDPHVAADTPAQSASYAASLPHPASPQPAGPHLAGQILPPLARSVAARSQARRAPSTGSYPILTAEPFAPSVEAEAPSAADSSSLEDISPAPPIPEPIAPPPPRLRSFPTRLGKHAVAAEPAVDAAPRWNPFTTEFGDLTDPTPRRRPASARNRKRSR